MFSITTMLIIRRFKVGLRNLIQNILIRDLTLFIFFNKQTNQDEIILFQIINKRIFIYTYVCKYLLSTYKHL